MIQCSVMEDLGPEHGSGSHAPANPNRVRRIHWCRGDRAQNKLELVAANGLDATEFPQAYFAA